MTVSVFNSEVSGLLIYDLHLCKNHGTGKEKMLLLSDLLSTLFFVDVYLGSV